MCFLLNLIKSVILNLKALSQKIILLVLFGCNCMIVFGGSVVYIGGNLDKFISVFMYSFSEKCLLIVEYVLFAPACPCMVFKGTKMVKAKN